MLTESGGNQFCDVLYSASQENAAFLCVPRIQAYIEVGSCSSCQPAGTTSGDVHGQEEGCSLHRNARVHRGARFGADSFKVHNTEGELYFLSRTTVIHCPTVVNSLTKVLAAEPQKHDWKDGVEKVQQIPQKSHSAQRDQVKVEFLGPATYAWRHKLCRHCLSSCAYRRFPLLYS